MSVLTQEEIGAIARVNRDLGHAQNLSRTSVAWRRRLLAIIDRLVAEVERLRARNEALEKVVKSVALVAHFGGLIDLSTDGALNMVRRLTIGHFDKSSPPEELRLALSALNPSEPNSSGGET